MRTLAAAGGLLLAAALAWFLLLPEGERPEAVAPISEPQPQQPPPPAEVAFPWRAAGAFVWHETDVDPEILGRRLRDAGFGWVAVFLHEGTAEDAVEPGWVERFRRASGLAVGGWGVLRAEPEREAALAHALLERHGLAFYVANAEADYAYTGPDGRSAERHGRSARFVARFRGLRPDLPAGLSSYCRPDTQDLDWAAWSASGFAFLPQAYVNDFGADAAPAVCTAAARRWFPAERVHPTIGTYVGRLGLVEAPEYARLLRDAGTTGFSVYLAETEMPAERWSAFGEAVPDLTS